MDLMAVTPTGSGKTTFFTGYMDVMFSILDNPELCPRAQFRVKKDPVMIVACPTKALQKDMVRESVIKLAVGI
jgi:replicative superfamily II helicase